MIYYHRHVDIVTSRTCIILQLWWTHHWVEIIQKSNQMFPNVKLILVDGAKY